MFHYPYNYDDVHFVQCDEWGGCWVMPCAPGTVYRADIQTCDHAPAGESQGGTEGGAGTGSGGTTDSQTGTGDSGSNTGYDCDANNPCNPLQTQGVFHYAYYQGDTQFVQCDAWGGCYVMPCGLGTVFNPDTQACETATAGGDATGGDATGGDQGGTGQTDNTNGDDTGYNCGSNNPCSPLLMANVFHYPNDSPVHFVQCDTWGGCWVMPCAPGTVYVVADHACRQQ